MPAVNSKALEMCKQIALDVLSLKIDEEIVMDFKDEPITLKRIK